MSYSAEPHRSTGDLITASIWNQAVSDNPAAIYSGAMSIASQAALDFIYASSATQLARMGSGGALQGPRRNAANNAWEWGDWGALAPLYANAISLTAASGVPFNKDTFAISGLTAKDKLLVVVWPESGVGWTNTFLYNNTNTVAISTAVTTSTPWFAILGLKVSTSLQALASLEMSTSGITTLASTLGTNWTGSWTLALRDDTVHNNLQRAIWAIYKLAGQ